MHLIPINIFYPFLQLMTSSHTLIPHHTLQDFPTESLTEFIPYYNGPLKKKTNDEIRKYWPSIRTFRNTRKHSVVYNLRVKDGNVANTLKQSEMSSIFRDQKHSFKVQASIGYILYKNTDQEMRYWHASVGHDRLFTQLVSIDNHQSWKEFMATMEDKDFIEAATKDRSSTAWSLWTVTNLLIVVYPMVEFPIGCPTISPPHVKENRAIISADSDSNGVTYKDSKCLFRALAYSKNQHSTLERSTNLYFNQFGGQAGIELGKFDGVKFSDLPVIENLFKISINVFTLDSESNYETARMIMRSASSHKHTLNLHLEGSHFSLIKNLRRYTKSYKCNYCDMLHKTLYALKRHILTCCGSTTLKHPAGEVKTGMTIFDKLCEIGVNVPPSLRHYDQFCVFDCETYKDQTRAPINTKTIEYLDTHVLASVSVCSTINGYTQPVTFVNDENDEYLVVSQMMDYLLTLSSEAKKIMMRRYEHVFQQIESARLNLISAESMAMDPTRAREILDPKIDKLVEELESWLTDVIVFGFNSKGYDIPMMKEHIIKYLHEECEEIQSCIKKNSEYMLIKTERLRFLDVLNYLAEGTSLTQYLSAMGVDERKFYWIYEQFTSMEVLKRTEFPEHGDFFNAMKNSNISKQEYEYCKTVWRERNMNSLRDMLIYYNECDVKPLCQAITKHHEFLISRGLDFKQGISISALSIKYLFNLKERDSPVFLFGHKFRDIYHLIRDNIRGGLSTVFMRHQEQGVTKIKRHIYGDEAKTTKICVGKDVSAMYLGNLTGRDMPTGRFVRRRCETGFTIEKSNYQGEKAAQFIEWLGHKLNVKFTHSFNGDEKRIGALSKPVDGYCESEKIVVNFSGCWLV
mgnify:FL=1